MTCRRSHRVGRALLAADVEEDDVLAGDDVADAVAVVGHRPEPAAGRHAARVLAQVDQRGLAVRRLGGGQAPRLTEHLL